MSRRGGPLSLLLLASVPLVASDIKDHPKGLRHESRALNYEITAPNASWGEFKGRSKAADFSFMNAAGVSLTVCAFPKDGEEDLGHVLEGIEEGLNKAGRDFAVLSRLPCRLLGEKGCRLVGEVSLVFRVRYEYTIFQHQGILYELIAGGPANRMPQASGDLRSIVASFRFLGRRKDWIEAHPARTYAALDGDAKATFVLGPVWSSDAFAEQPPDSLWIAYGAGPSHLQVLVDRLGTSTPEASRDSDERCTAKVVEGYTTIAKGELDVAGRRWLTFEGTGRWGERPTRILGASLREGAVSVRAVLFWPEARAAEGRSLLAEVVGVANLEFPAEAADLLALPAAKRPCAGEATVRELAGAELVLSVGEGERVFAFAPSPDGTRIAVSKERSLEVSEIGGKETRFVKDGNGATSLAWRADGKRLWLVDREGAVVVWNAERGETRKLGRAAMDAAPWTQGRLLLVEREDAPRPDLGWGVQGPQRLVSVREDGSDERVLLKTRLSRILLCGTDPATGRALLLDFDAGVLRRSGARLREVAPDGAIADGPSVSPLGTGWAAHVPQGLLYQPSIGDTDASGSGLAFLHGEAAGEDRCLDLPLHQGPIAVDVDGRIYFQSWIAPDGAYATCLYRLRITDALKRTWEGASGQPFDDARLADLDAKLAEVLPEQPGAADLRPEGIARAAAAVAEALGPHVEGGLGMQAGSIDALEGFVRVHSEAFARHPRTLLAAGCYAGEVLRKECDGTWAPGDGRVEGNAWWGDDDSPIACVAMPLAEFWSLAYADESWIPTVEDRKERLGGRQLLLALSRRSAHAAIEQAEGPDLVAARKAWEKGHDGEALEALDKAMKTHPASARLRLYGFQRAYAAGRLDLAATWAEEATTLDPKSAEAWSDRGVLAIAGDPDHAVEWLRKAVELDPGKGAHLLRLGYAYLAKQDAKAATACFERASEDGSCAVEARRRLDELRKK